MAVVSVKNKLVYALLFVWAAIFVYTVWGLRSSVYTLLLMLSLVYTNRVHYKGSTLHVYLFALQPPCGTVQLHDTDIASLLSPAVVLEGAAPAEQAERVALFWREVRWGRCVGERKGLEREGGREMWVGG